MTFFGIGESTFSTISSASSLAANLQLAKEPRLRDPIHLTKAHLKFLRSQLFTKCNGIAIAAAEAVCFTSIDQAFILWGAASAVIFSTAQFSLLSWTTQALIDTAITGICIALTSSLTWQIAQEGNLRWVVFLWAVLMSGGMALTAYGIFYSVGAILVNLCPIWLSLCTLGYVAMSIKMRSYSFTAAAIVHAFATVHIDLVPSWQFLASGLVMSLTLFFFSVVPWDMRAVPATSSESSELC